MVARCLERQTFPKNNWEWIVATNYEPPKGTIQVGVREKGDYFYSLNRDWNSAFRIASGSLIVSLVDLLWFPPDTLERMWNHYVREPRSCIGLTGNQYDRIENGKPEGLIWADPRLRSGQSFYEIPPYDLELCIASIPLAGIKDVGGVDEDYDKFPAWSEKDLACRLAVKGYKCYIDQSIQYRALYHPRLSDKWDELYPKSTAKFMKDYAMIQQGKRLKLTYL